MLLIEIHTAIAASFFSVLHDSFPRSIVVKSLRIDGREALGLLKWIRYGPKRNSEAQTLKKKRRREGTGQDTIPRGVLPT